MRIPEVAFFFVVAVFSSLAHGRIVVSDGPVRLGVWNSNLAEVVKEARARHLPMMLVLGNEGCHHCVRLANSFDGVAFNLWQKDRNILMAYVHNYLKGRKISSQTVRKLIPFFKAKNRAFPLVYVWWPKDDGTEVGKVFSGRRDSTDGDAHEHLSMEIMSAIDKALGSYLTIAPHRTLEQILKDCPKKISTLSTVGGTVSIEPESGMMTEGEKVKLKACPDGKHVFFKWTDPDGTACGHRQELTVTGSMAEGAYKAHFKAVADILPPLQNSSPTSICIQAGEPFKHEIALDQDRLPVSFKTGKLPAGVKFDSCCGIVTGTARKEGTNIIDIVIIGSDLHHTTVTNRLMLIVNPKSNPSKRRSGGNTRKKHNEDKDAV